MNLMYEKDVKIIIDVLQELRHIVEDEGYETNTDKFLNFLKGSYINTGIEELNFCISKNCRKGEFESEELGELIERLKDSLSGYEIRCRINKMPGSLLTSSIKRTYMNIFIKKRVHKKPVVQFSVDDSVVEGKLNEVNDMQYISEKDAGIIVDILEEIRHIIEDDNFVTNIDSIIEDYTRRKFKYNPINNIDLTIYKKGGIGYNVYEESIEYEEFYDRLVYSLKERMGWYKIVYSVYMGQIYLNISKKRLNESKSIDSWKDETLEAITRLKYIVEDEGSVVETIGNLSNVVVCRVYKKIGSISTLYGDDLDVVEFVDRVKEDTNSIAWIQDFKGVTSIQFRKRDLSSATYSMDRFFNNYNESKRESFSLWISKTSKVIEDLKYIVEDEGYKVFVDTTGHAPLLCLIQKKLNKAVDMRYTPYSISGYGSDESIEEFIDRLKDESNCELKIDNNNTNICIRLYEKQLKMFESSSIDELECSYPPIPFTKYDVDEIIEKVEEFRYIIEDEGYNTNFDRFKHHQNFYADINLYISRHFLYDRSIGFVKGFDSCLDDFFSDELEEFIHRLIEDLPNFYFGDYGNTLRSDNFKDYIRSNLKSGGNGSLYFTFYIYKRKKSDIVSVFNESVDHLNRRGVNKETTRFIYDELSGDTFFFLYNLSGQLTGYQKYNPAYPKVGQGRLGDPRKAKYFISSGDEGSGKKIAVWGLETLNIKDRYLFITEGIFDCVKIHNAGYPGIAVLCNDPSGSMRNWLNSLPQKKIVIYDNDQAGRALKSIGDYSFFVPGDNKDLGDLKQEEATEFIKGCIDEIENKKVNESVKNEKHADTLEAILAEIKDISYIMEDENCSVHFFNYIRCEVEIIYPEPVHKWRRSKLFGETISTTQKLDIGKYKECLGEFIDRCSSICDIYGYSFVEIGQFHGIGFKFIISPPNHWRLHVVDINQASLETNEELVKNPNLLKSYLIKLIEKIRKVYPEIKNGDIRYDKDSPIYNKLVIHISDIRLSSKIKKIIDSHKLNLEKNEIVLSYREYKRSNIDFDNEFNIILKDSYYLEYIIYVKNIFTKRVNPSRYIYHYGGNGVDEYNILKNGLIPKKHSVSKLWSNEIQLEYPEAIFAVNSKEVWRESAAFRIDTKGLKNKWWTDLNFSNRDELIMTFEPIPASHIERIWLVDGKLLD